MFIENPVLKTAAIHDLSGFGRASLSVIMPVLSTMGIQVCPLPTAVLSTHTGGFEGYTYLDLTDEMSRIIKHWKQIDLQFDCIYSGFLGSEKQVDIVINFIKKFKKDKQLVIVDPVLGDDGEPYGPIKASLIHEMKRLARHAGIITPNFTELCLLQDKQYKNSISLDEAKEWLINLSKQGPEIIIASSVPLENSSLTSNVLAYDKINNRFWKAGNSYIPVSYPGTGDIFTCVICGALLQGDSLSTAIDRAVQFVVLGVKESYGYSFPSRDGIVLEKILPVLREPLTKIYCELV